MKAAAAGTVSAPTLAGPPTWAEEVHATLKAANLRQLGVVPAARWLLRQESLSQRLARSERGLR